jgi:long-subunit fatty acid transport protein
MKKVSLLMLAAFVVGQLFAGGILTNTNQSAMFTRMQARDATLGIDAVYYNPAGLSFLKADGFHLSINNQSLWQTRNITSDYSYLNNGDYEGKITAAVFPSLYAAYKLDKFVFSVGFNPIGGGGGGTYESGLPLFEYSIADLVPALSSQGAQGYSMDAYFEGTSIYFGYQANFTYQINEQLSVAIGGRYVQAKETYNGSLNDVEIDMGGTWMSASSILTGIADQASAGASALTPLIDGGLGGLTPEQAQLSNYIDEATQTQIEEGITAFGVDPEGVTLTQAQTIYLYAASEYTAKASILEDQSADTEKSATGFTPILSIDYKVNDDLNFSFKYEHKTKLEFENKTAQDFTTGFDTDGTAITMFPDGEITNLDLPSQIVLGAAYRPTEKLLISTGFHAYLDKQANWDGRQDSLDGNSWEFALGLEYDINDMFTISTGWLRTKSGANPSYQNGLSYSLPSHTFGAGLALNFNEKTQLNLGASYTSYTLGEGSIEHNFAGSGIIIPITETYDKDVLIVAVGLNFSFGANK